ncbi:putative rare lipoprotein A [Mycobacterium xenopi 3993]|nr:putative rare lipoprotein A [Mycobacterium xenopi 3993]
MALLPRAIRAPFWLISDATLLWWPVHRRPSVTENRLKAAEHPAAHAGGRGHCVGTADRVRPDRILRRGVRGFRAGVYWSKPWTGNDFHVSTRQEAGMVRAEKATAVADIAERFKAATAALITEYRG